MAGLYHIARLNESWFRLDDPVVSAFVERWRPETHTFHMPFGECTITLQNVAYQLGLPIDGHFVSCCLKLHPEVRSELQLYARAYIMMLLGTQLFGDKSGTRIHIRWLPNVARLEDMGGYSWGSAALSWLYRCMCRMANRHVVGMSQPYSEREGTSSYELEAHDRSPTGWDVSIQPLLIIKISLRLATLYNER
ncbi:hypothetical protein Ahy_B04g072985 isoform B [Arachis hypogaea]|uniref:Aminotransferase-like plant mobile domain-containing protein n=1 Tax=Arachis hypogaea TaxID=3818 RepID=A0A444ZPG1_ARAHY|nr:hypothetical protein Ahy_B04g072985 isoform B [Arachis hypogaea]